MGLLDKILGVLLALAIVCGAGSLWYADREHAQIKPLQEQIAAAQIAQRQAAADRDSAIQAARIAQVQLTAAEDAASAARISAANAASAASAARAQLTHLAKTPTSQKLLDTTVPAEVWQTIYNSGK